MNGMKVVANGDLVSSVNIDLSCRHVNFRSVFDDGTNNRCV